MKKNLLKNCLRLLLVFLLPINALLSQTNVPYWREGFTTGAGLCNLTTVAPTANTTGYFNGSSSGVWWGKNLYSTTGTGCPAGNPHIRFKSISGVIDSGELVTPVVNNGIMELHFYRARASRSYTIWTTNDTFAQTTNWNLVVFIPGYASTAICVDTTVQVNSATAKRLKIVTKPGADTDIDSIWLTNYSSSQNIAPLLSTSKALSITASSATLGGNVSDSGSSSVSQRGIVYSTNLDPTIANNKVSIGNGLGSFSQNITGLTASTLYHFRAFAINSTDTAYGADSTFTTLATSNEVPQTITGLQLWLDASDINNNGSNPNNGTSISTWKDRSGFGNDASVLLGQNPGILNTNQINGKSVVKFNRTSSVLGSVYNVPNVDIRAQNMPKITIFTVYKQGAQTSPVADQAIWGCDDGGWDRFFFSSFPSYSGGGNNPDNGGVSQGTYANVVNNAGLLNKTQLLTAVYDNQTNLGSGVYFNGQNIATFTDVTTLTDAKTSLRIGFDGDDNCYNGDIAEMMVYNRKLTDCEIQTINKYLSNKYGVAFTSVSIDTSGPTTFNVGDSVVLSSSVTASSYKWLKNGSVISGAVSKNYTVKQSGNYQVIVTSTCSDTSAAKLVVVKPVLVVNTSSITSIGSTSATLGGNVLDSGTATVTERGVVYGTTINPTTSNTKVQIGSGLGAYSQTVTGLTPSTLYHVRAYAINSVGTAYGADSSFTTGEVSTSLPSISSFFPQTGPYGTVVTITGTNFNTTPVNNLVFFGAAQAYVNAATANTLTVTLPQGATYAPLTVLNLGSNLSATSFDYFKPTFSPNKIAETSLDFENRANFQSGVGSQPSHTAIGEIDGDGMPDIALINTYPDSSVSIFRNNSIKGRMSVVSRMDLPVRGRPNKVILADFNGDGKRDVAVLCSNGSKICVFPNTSTAGTLSFDTRIDLTTNENPTSFDVADLNGDGKPEIACSNQLNVNVSVYKNTSSVSAISFATKQDISAGSSPMGLKFGDVDGDGKPDFAVLNPFQSTYSIYRNTSSAGNISFASSVSFPADTFIAEIFMSDLDLNGKLDLLLANSTGSRIVIAPNTSTIGTVSFAPRMFIQNGKALRYLTIGNMDGDSMPDILTFGGYLDSLRIFQNKSTPGNIVFNQTGAIYTNSSSFVALEMADIDLDGKPDIVSSETSGKLSILRQRYPIANDTISGAQNICIGSSTTLLGSNVINYYNRPFTYKWLKSTTSATTGFGPAGGADTLMNYSTTALTTNTWFRRAYYWDYTADTTAATKITVSSISSNTIGSNQTINSGAIPATLVGNTPTGGTFTYQWISSTSSNTGYSNAIGASTGKDYSPAALTVTTYYKRIVIAGSSCVDTSAMVTITVIPPAPTSPSVSTGTSSSITTSSAVLSGNVISDGGATVTDRGVVFSTTANPTTLNAKVVIGAGLGSFSQNITLLLPNTIYHYRAYAINSVGTSYGADSSFTTLAEQTNIEKINNAFSPNNDGINDTWEIENAAELKDHVIIVYNIFGQEVFSQTGYDIPWDGKVDGNPVPSAEYYYLIKGPKVNKRGALLIKNN